MAHQHVPVLLKEVVEMIRAKRQGVYLDGTLGLGGHAEGILKAAGDCTLIGIDRDEQALDVARGRLHGQGKVHYVQGSFSHMKSIANNLGFTMVDGILLDLGLSGLQLRSEGRGFSFLQDAPLDMRMDRTQPLSAWHIVNEYPEKRLASVIWEYGEERRSRRIARDIVNARNRAPVSTCRELADLIEKSTGRRGRIHPATKTFQALRIEVNHELAELSEALESGADLLRASGRFCVISYHSLEDRIVKNAFRNLAKDGLFRIITRKPVVPGASEVRENPSSRSAKLRVAERAS